MPLEIVFLGVIALGAIYYFLKIVTEISSRVYHIQKLPGPPMFNWIVGNMYPLQDSPGTPVLCWWNCKLTKT
jgi:hypothetical protein